LMAKRPRRPKRPQNSWQASAAFRAMARSVLVDFNNRRSSMPKCGAARKSDGQPCQRLAMANGKCHYHGGRVPRGAQWHKHQWPTNDGPAAEKRLADKQKQTERQAQARAKRLAVMTPEERERYDQWQRAHRPGSAAKRSAARMERESARNVQELMAVPETVSPEVDELRANIDQLKYELATRTLFD
jgi:hypothetical protein